MIRRSPAEYYIKFLVAHPDQLEVDEIEERVREKQLDYIGAPYVEKLRSSMSIPKPFYPYDEDDIGSQRFLIREGLVLFFIPNRHMRVAQGILDTPKAKEVVESSFISGFDSSWIHALLKREGYSSTPEALDLYRQFFWNLDLVDSMELKALIQMRINSHQVKDPWQLAGTTAAWKAHYSDPRWLSARMSNTPIAGMMHQLRMGLLPQNLEVAKIASAARTAATVLTFDSLTRGDKPEISQGYALTAKLMTEVLEATGTPESELFGQLHQLMLEQEHDPVPQIGELTEGNHTVEVMPVKGDGGDDE